MVTLAETREDIPARRTLRVRWRIATTLFIHLLVVIGIVRMVEGRGGIAYLKGHFLHRAGATDNAGNTARAKMFESLPTPGSRPIVFLGDSITSGVEWHELFPLSTPVLNRGIGGQTSADILHRTPEIVRLRPLGVFLMAGANDPTYLGYSPADSAQTIGDIVRVLRKDSPETRIYIESVLPSRAPKFSRWGAQLNEGLRAMADGEKIFYIDLRPAFVDADGNLDVRYTVDGLHLSPAGYQLWKALIEPTVASLTATPGG